jgi:hypothetical protein
MGDLGQSHIEITVGGTTYPLVIDTWQEVDAIDFAPRAVAGSPAFSEMGLYIDVPQQRFDHGFGKWRFSEEASYAFTGNLVDTSHGFISLFTLPTQVWSESNKYIRRFTSHRDRMVFAATSGLWVQKADLSFYKVWATDTWDVMTNGAYMFLGNGGRMQVSDLGTATAGAATTLTDTGRAWTVDLFNGGEVVIYEGTGAGQTRTVSDTSATILTVSVAWATNPSTDSKYFVRANAGVGANPPNSFWRLAVSGGFMWGSEYTKPYVHFWAELDGTDAEGQQDTDTGAVRVGPGDVHIENMLAFQNQLWVMRYDGAWVVGDDNIAYHTLNMADQTHALNFRAATVWNGFMVFALRNNIFKYKSGLQNITPPRWNDEMPYKRFGRFEGLVPRGDFLYAAGKSSQSYSDEALEDSNFGALFRTDGVGWHKIADAPSPVANPYACKLWLDAVNDRLYWAAVHNSSPDVGYLWYIPLDENSELPYRYYPLTGDHNWYSSFYDFGLRRIDKSWANVTLDGDFPTGCTVDVAYRGDDTAAWTALGTVSAAMGTVAFPAATEHKKVQIRLNLQSTISGNTPAVKAIILKAMMRPKVLYSVSTDVIVQDDISGPDQLALGLTAKEIRTGLKAARDSVSPITLRDLHGVSASAYLSSLRFQLVEYEHTDAVAEVARCTFVYINQAS